MDEQLTLPLERMPADQRVRDFRDWPNLPAATICRHAQFLGEASEREVIRKLAQWGYAAFSASVGLPYDLVLDVGGSLVRIQVKAVMKPRDGVWRFRMRRGYRNSATGTYDYGASDFDLAALVALPRERVLFTSSKATLHKVPDSLFSYPAELERDSLEAALVEIGASEPAAPGFPLEAT